MHNGYRRSYQRPYGRDTYNDIGRKMANLEPFAGNSMHGDWETRHTFITGAANPHEVYVVYSYATVIAIYDPVDRTLYENTLSYSPTTSHHQHAARMGLGHYNRDGQPNYTVECEGERATLDAARNLLIHNAM